MLCIEQKRKLRKSHRKKKSQNQSRLLINQSLMDKRKLKINLHSQPYQQGNPGEISRTRNNSWSYALSFRNRQKKLWKAGRNVWRKIKNIIVWLALLYRNPSLTMMRRTSYSRLIQQMLPWIKSSVRSMQIMINHLKTTRGMWTNKQTKCLRDWRDLIRNTPKILKFSNGLYTKSSLALPLQDFWSQLKILIKKCAKRDSSIIRFTFSTKSTFLCHSCAWKRWS